MFKIIQREGVIFHLYTLYTRVEAESADALPDVRLHPPEDSLEHQTLSLPLGMQSMDACMLMQAVTAAAATP